MGDQQGEGVALIAPLKMLFDIQAIKACLLDLPGPYSMDNANT